MVLSSLSNFLSSSSSSFAGKISRAFTTTSYYTTMATTMMKDGTRKRAIDTTTSTTATIGSSGCSNPSKKKKNHTGSRQPNMFACFATKKNSKPRERQIFCDLDGVLVDFERGVQELLTTGNNSGLKSSCSSSNFISSSNSKNNSSNKSSSNSSSMWAAIHRAPHFYRDLAWTADGPELWEALVQSQLKQQRSNNNKNNNLHILTGVCRESAGADKLEWCKRELCVEVQWRDMAGSTSGSSSNSKTKRRAHVRVPHPGHNVKRQQQQQQRDDDETNVCTVITCWSVNKHCECRPGDVLIDDRPEKLQAAWEGAGGIFVHHVNTFNTLRILRELGILQPTTTTMQSASTPLKPTTAAASLEQATTMTPATASTVASVASTTTFADNDDEGAPTETAPVSKAQGSDRKETALQSSDLKESSASSSSAESSEVPVA